MMETFRRDILYGLRILRRNPSFAVIAILMLALGIGVNTTIFCWIRTIVLNPLPGVLHPAELVALLPSFRGTIRFSEMPYPDFRDLSGLKNVFTGVIATNYTSALLRINDTNQWVYGELATANTFDLLGVKPERGRSFLPEDDEGEDAHPVLIISHALWQQRFGGASDIVGTQVELNRHSFTIVGVLPLEFHGFNGGLRVDFWAPLSMHNEILNYGSFESRTFRWITPIARLRSGIKLEQAQAAVSVFSKQLAGSYPTTNKEVEFKVVPLSKSPLGGQGQLSPILRILFAVSAGVLVIVIVNVANLLLARNTGRTTELAIRVAIGAGRLRLIRQLLTECVVLASAGGVLGVLFAFRAVTLFSFFAPKTNLHFDYDFHIDSPALGFTALLILCTTIIFGLAPALQSSGTDLQTSLREAGRGSGSSFGRERFRKFLIVTEVALALLLLIGAGLSIQGFERARKIDLGFDPSHLLYADLTLVPNRYSAERGKIFDRELRDRLAALPGVQDAGLASVLPLGFGHIFAAPLQVDGYSSTASDDRLASFLMISPGYFGTLRIPILQGRDFTDQDDLSKPNVAIINDALARRFWPGLSPIGRTFRMAVGVAPMDTFTVIGTVKSGKYHALEEPSTPLLYLSYLQRPLASLFMGVLVRTRGNPELIAPLVRREIHVLDAAVEPATIETMEQHIQPAFEPARVSAMLLGMLGFAALILASLGLYGVMAYVASRRSHEIGIRMALGAEPRDILRLVIMQGMALVLAGVAIGLLAAVAMTRLLANVLYGVSATDPLTFAAVLLLLALVALLACYIPARRAMRVDPLIALRHG
jgi:predicted permease